jgi:phage tail tape-measure protein
VGGTLFGAATGAAIGHSIDPTGGALVGGVAGALLGGAIGNDMDWREQGYYYNEQPYDRYDDSGYVRPPPARYYGPTPRYNAPSPYDGY